MGERPGVSCNASRRGERAHRVEWAGFSSERKGEVVNRATEEAPVVGEEHEDVGQRTVTEGKRKGR